MEIQEKLNDVKRYLREIKFSLIFGDGNITLVNDLEAFSGKVPFFFGKKAAIQKNRYIDQIKSLDGILTGSAALSMYRINGKRIFGREPNDLDFLVTRDSFIKFCGMNSFSNVKYEDRVVSLDFSTGKDLGTDSYGYHRGYRFYTDFDVIGTDEPQSFETVGDLKVAKIMDIVNYKVRLAEEYISRAGQKQYDRDANAAAEKHVNDLFMIVTTIAAYESDCIGQKA